MENILTIESLEHFMEEISNIQDFTNLKGNFERVLYRGQSDKYELIPSIGRIFEKNDLGNGKFENKLIPKQTSDVEIQMLGYLKRVGFMLNEFDSDLDLLIKAQHYGMKTRLLDWTTNPLVALFFAIKEEKYFDRDSYLYILKVPKDFILESKNHLYDSFNPFTINKTYVIRPRFNNNRVKAQSGWFTIHDTYQGYFIPLEKNPDMFKYMDIYKIPVKIKIDLLRKISDLGANSRTIYADFEGLCTHANYKFHNMIKR